MDTSIPYIHCTDKVIFSAFKVLSPVIKAHLNRFSCLRVEDRHGFSTLAFFRKFKESRI